MKPSSAKAKGRRLQNQVTQLILERFSGVLEEDDVRGAIMGESGEDIKLSPLARKHFPYSTECKNQERLNIWNSWKQAKENTREGCTPLLVYTKNRHELMVTLTFDDFLKMIS
ncbi:MAG: hypothetical protein VW683_00395 [Betaproteobacteria bacterium]|jgi:hypothetical protein